MRSETTPVFDPITAHPLGSNDFETAPGARLGAVDWAAAMREIESILMWITMNPGAYVTLDVRNRVNRYVQAGSSDDGRIFVETTDDAFTKAEPYRAEDRAHLVRLGWLHESLRDDTPNWWRESDPQWFYPHPMMAELLVRALVDVHRAQSPADIAVSHGVFEN